MDFDLDKYLDAEQRTAERTITPNVYHYTSAIAAIEGILASGRIWLSPFSSTNDLWESMPTYPTLNAHHDDTEDLRGIAFWNALDQEVRVQGKVACFSQDWNLPDYVSDRNAARGWNHPATWAHYGDQHRGVALRFDRTRLTVALEGSSSDGARIFHGPVEYVTTSVGPNPGQLDIGQLKEFGVDAVAARYAMKEHQALYFRKHQDWAYEDEYRLVRLDQSPGTYELDISYALTGVVLGVQFPAERLSQLQRSLAIYSGVEVARLSYHNRRLAAFPLERWDELPEVAFPVEPLPHSRRAGSLTERVTALQQEEESAESRRQIAIDATTRSRRLIQAAFTSLSGELARRVPNTPELLETIQAIPSPLRRRAPGTPGEVVDLEWGQLLVLMSSRQHPREPVVHVGAAFQVLDGGTARLHAVAWVERDALPARDLWRLQIPSTLESLETDAAEVLSELLRDAVPAAMMALSPRELKTTEPPRDAQ